MIPAILAASRELDMLVAEKVLGWKWAGHNWDTSPAHKVRTIIEDGRKREEAYDSWESKGPHKVLISPEGREFYFCGCDKGEDIYSFPAYSTDIAAAWLVVEKLCPPENNEEMVALFYRAGSSDWVCEFSSYGPVDAPTAPLVICLAALKAVGAT